MKKYNSEYVKNYNIKDIISLLLKKIWVIVAWTVVFAIVVAIFQYEDADVAINKVEVESFSEDELAEVERYIKNLEVYELEEQELNDSIAYNLNPYNVATIQTQYYISAETESEAYNVLLALIKYIESGTMASDIANATEFDTQENIHNLIKLDYSLCTGENVGTVFKIKVYGEDEMKCQTLKGAMDTVLIAYTNSLDSVIADNELTLIGSNFAEGYDVDLKTRQTDKETILKAFSDALEEDYTALSLEQKQYADAKKQELKEKESSVEVTSGNNISKSLVMGAALGFLLAVVIYVLIYIFGTTMNSEVEIQDNYDVLYLGKVRTDKNKKWEAWVEKVFDGKAAVDEETSVSNISNNISGVCKQNNIKKVAVFCDEASNKEEYLNKLYEKLKKVDIEIVICKDIYTALETSKDIVLVKCKGKSKSKEIIKEFNVCAAQDADVLGYIVVQ